MRSIILSLTAAILALGIVGCAQLRIFPLTSTKLPIEELKEPAAMEPPLRLASPFSSHMVLQRHKPVRVWGWDRPGQSILVRVGDAEGAAFTDAHGRWMVELGPMEAGGPCEMAVNGSSRIVLDDVLVGEVWLASGQSNMEWHLLWSEDGEQAVAEADWPNIRLLTIPHTTALRPQETVANDGWKLCSPDTVPWFSAVAYYFGREIHQEYDVPVGLINSSWGGSSMEAWTPIAPLHAQPGYDVEVKLYTDYIDAQLNSEEMAAYQKKLKEWSEQTGGEEYHKDPGDDGEANGWAEADFDDSGWETMDLPGPWEQKGLPGLDGVVWFRREFTLPDDWPGGAARLELGIIDDTDYTYVNGEQVGATTEETLNFWSAKRRYDLDEGVLKPGRNVIAVRVFDRYLAGGFMGPPSEMFIEPKGAGQISLKGDWLYKVSVPLLEKPFPPAGPENHVTSLLYNAMIHPLMPLSIRGLLWYQGETNTARPDRYLNLSKLMIHEWRAGFDQGVLPFLLVQLAGWDCDWPTWMEIREAQRQTLSVPNTGLVTAADIGTPDDIHPKNKLDVGHRLALVARAIVYGENIVYSGPNAHLLTREGNHARVHFDHVGDGLVTKSGGPEVEGFEIMGQNGEFLPAEARLDGSTVVVWNDGVVQPVAVRYAWEDYPACDLYNRNGLPAFPFLEIVNER